MKKYILFILLLLLTTLVVGCTQPQEPEIKEYTLTFLGLNDEVIETKKLPAGSVFDYPDFPEYEGHDFLFWDSEETILNSDLTIRAIYDAHTFQVKFYDKDRHKVDEQTIKFGESATAPTLPTVENFEFVGWDKEFTNVKEDLKVMAIYKQINCTVTFKDSRGNVLKTETVKNGESATAPTPPTIPFHTFKKWDKDFTNVSKDITVTAIYTKDAQLTDKQDVNYWLQVLSYKYDIYEKIYTKEEIAKYNEIILSSPNDTDVVDVTTLDQTVTKAYVNGLIGKYTKLSRYPVYDNDTKKALSGSEINAILLNRNLDNIPSTVNVQFGIITDFSWMRAYPSNAYGNKYTTDQFQETSLNVGEGVAIYHESSDQKWYYVQAQTYHGWVEKQYIATCSFDTMKNFLKTDNKIVVIADYVVLENAHVRMGQAFPLMSSGDNIYNISFPLRNDDGTLELKEITINNDGNYSVGYLDYTYENLFKQCFKLLGIPYSWGDKEKLGRDCSSTQMSVYNTFGFMMPRNGGSQNDIPTFGKSVYGVNDEIMKKAYHPGALIFSSGHVMMYIGEDAEGVSYLFHNTSAGNGECILQPLSGYGGNKIIGTLDVQSKLFE